MYLFVFIFIYLQIRVVISVYPIHEWTATMGSFSRTLPSSQNTRRRSPRLWPFSGPSISPARPWWPGNEWPRLGWKWPESRWLPADSRQVHCAAPWTWTWKIHPQSVENSLKWVTKNDQSIWPSNLEMHQPEEHLFLPCWPCWLSPVLHRWQTSADHLQLIYSGYTRSKLLLIKKFIVAWLHLLGRVSLPVWKQRAPAFQLT